MFHFGDLLGRIQEESFFLASDWAHAIKQNGKTFHGTYSCEIWANVRFCETKGEKIARCVHCLVCLQRDSEHHRAFMATNELSSFKAPMSSNARHDRSTNFLN